MPGTSIPYDIRAPSRAPPRACTAHEARALNRHARHPHHVTLLYDYHHLTLLYDYHHLTLLYECMSCTPPSACRRGGEHSSVAVPQGMDAANNKPIHVLWMRLHQGATSRADS